MKTTIELKEMRSAERKIIELIETYKKSGFSKDGALTEIILNNPISKDDKDLFHRFWDCV